MSTKVCKKDVLQAVVLADDFTTKLTPSQNVFPSILMPVINIPLFDYMIETLIKSKIQEIFLYCSSHMDSLKKYVEKKSSNGVVISLIISDGCRSLGDALRDIDTKGCIRGCFLLIRGDAFINANLKMLLNVHSSKLEKDKGAAMTMVLRNVGSTKGSLLSDERYLLVSGKNNKQILNYEKVDKKGKKVKFQLKWLLERTETQVNTCYLDTHVYLCSPSVLPLFADNFDFQTMDDFIRGVLMNEEILNSRIYWHPLNKEDYALPITSWKTYHALNRDILLRYSFPLAPNGFPLLRDFISMPRCVYKHKTAALAKGCILEKDCILGHSSILGNNTTITRSVVADRCILGSNVVISDSYIFSDVKVEDNCTIRNSVLFSNCVIGNDSQIDGCILCPGINIVARSEYIDVIAECINSSLSTTKMSEIDEEFLYFKKNEVAECDSSFSESSNSEKDTEERDSPIPDDTNMFLSEVIDSLLRGYQDKLKCDNLILEINSSRYAYNVSVREVTYNVIKAILSLPLHYFSETKTPVNDENYRKNLKTMISYFKTIILNYIKNEDAQDDCLRAIEDVASTTDELLPFLQQLLHKFYAHDILSEERILKWWYESEDGDALQSKVRDVVQPFIKWLQEAEEDSSDDESDD